MADLSGPDRVIEAGLLTRAAGVEPTTLDVARRTVEVTFSKGARVVRGGFFTEPFIEELSLDPKHVRLERLQSGNAPVLNSHQSADLEDVIGVVESAALDKGEGRATLRFATDDPAADRVWNKVRQGIVRNVSVGYLVHKFEETKASADGSLPIRRAIDWEPYEISPVPMGADPGAQVRTAAAPHQCVIVMRDKETRAMDEPIRTDVRHERQPLQPGDLEFVDPPATPAPAPADPAATERALGVEEERTRVEAIMRGCRNANLSVAFMEQLIKDKVPRLEAMEKILEQVRLAGLDTKGPGKIPSGVIVSPPVGDPNAAIWQAMTRAILHRLVPKSFELDDHARQYRGQTLVDLARACVRARGRSTSALSASEVISEALNVRGGMHTTSDFANILENVADKVLRRAYDEAAPTWLPFARRQDFQDFKPARRVQIGEAPALMELTEHGEIQSGTIADAKETTQLKSYAAEFDITRTALVNDDLSAFDRVPTQFARSARMKEADLVYQQLTDTALLMGDGNALFTSGHGNLAGTSAVISLTSLSVGRQAMLVQTDIGGTQYLNIMPSFLVVPTALLTLAQQIAAVNVLYAAQTTDVNVFAGALRVIADPRLDAASATAWYLIADPNTQAVDVIEYGYLTGQSGPRIESRVGWRIEGLEMKCVHDFAAKMLDWRGVFKNAGA